MSSGRVFQSLGAATANDRSLKIKYISLLDRRCCAVFDVVLQYAGKEYRALLISVVRTQRGVVNDSTNAGFLSDPKLVNTAISRAADYVAVVGDPVAICTRGNCRTLWLSYIEVCSRNGGLQPPTVTVDWIRSQLQRSGSPAEAVRLRDSEYVSPDEILEELAKQAADTTDPVPFVIVIDEGYGVLSSAGSSERKKADDDVASDREAFLRLASEQPDKYVCCQLEIVSQRNIYAKFLDETVCQRMATNGIRDVQINGRRNCERAFSSDEVLVELFGRDSASEVTHGKALNPTHLTSQAGVAVGKVCGVLRECVPRKNRHFVCAADGNTSSQGIVRPLDESLPCFRTYVNQKDRDRVILAIV